MKQLFADGLAKMQAGDIDARLSRRPIERYQWPLGAALFFFAASFLMRERKRLRATSPRATEAKKPLAMAAILLLLASASFAAAPGLEAYRQNKFSEAYEEFQKTLKENPQTHAADKIQFDAGAAAYKMKDYGKALNSFSQALLSPDAGLQSKSHYNLGNTLYQRGEGQKKDDAKLTDWTNALQHYEQSLKITPDNKEAKENLEDVKRKIEELKQKREQQPPPSPSPKPQDDKKDDPKKDNKDQQQQSKQDQQKDQEQKQQDQKDQSGKDDQQKPEKGDEQSQDKNESGEDKKDEPKPGETPSPSPSGDEQAQQKQDSSPSPSPQESDGSDKRDKQDSSESDQQKPGQSPSSSDKERRRCLSLAGRKQGARRLTDAWRFAREKTSGRSKSRRRGKTRSGCADRASRRASRTRRSDEREAS